MSIEKDRELAAALALAAKLGVLDHGDLVARLDQEVAARSEPEQWLLQGSVAANYEDLLHVLTDVAQGHPLFEDPISVLDLLGMAVDQRHLEEVAVVPKACGTYYDHDLPEDLDSLAGDLVLEVDLAWEPAWERMSSTQIDAVLAADDGVTRALRKLLKQSRGRSAWTSTLEYVCCGEGDRSGTQGTG